MNLTVNGEPREAPPGCTLGSLLQTLALGEQRVAVERNGSIVPRSLHATTRLDEGDRIEIVRAIGGG